MIAEGKKKSRNLERYKRSFSEELGGEESKGKKEKDFSEEHSLISSEQMGGCAANTLETI